MKIESFDNDNLEHFITCSFAAYACTYAYWGQSLLQITHHQSAWRDTLCAGGGGSGTHVGLYLGIRLPVRSTLLQQETCTRHMYVCIIAQDLYV